MHDDDANAPVGSKAVSAKTCTEDVRSALRATGKGIVAGTRWRNKMQSKANTCASVHAGMTISVDRKPGPSQVDLLDNEME